MFDINSLGYPPASRLRRWLTDWASAPPEFPTTMTQSLMTRVNTELKNCACGQMMTLAKGRNLRSFQQPLSLIPVQANGQHLSETEN
jgi:hypothetical protein